MHAKSTPIADRLSKITLCLHHLVVTDARSYVSIILDYIIVVAALRFRRSNPERIRRTVRIWRNSRLIFCQSSVRTRDEGVSDIIIFIFISVLPRMRRCRFYFVFVRQSGREVEEEKKTNSKRVGIRFRKLTCTPRRRRRTIQQCR